MTNFKKLHKLLVAISLSACCQQATAQLEIGGWQTHFAYNNISQIVQTPEKIYALSNGNLFSVDKEYNSIETYSKLNGLTDGIIQNIAYDEKSKALVICYNNLNIDIIQNGKTYRLTDIANKEISNKVINNISFGDNKIYLSCGFGIVVINIQKKEVASTYIIGENSSYVSVLQTQVSEDSIYALTNNKLYVASLSNKDLSNYNNWNFHYLPTNKAKTICYFANRLNLFGDVWSLWGGANGWEPSFYSYITNVKKVNVYKDKLTIVGELGYLATYNNDFSQDTVIVTKIQDASIDAKNNILWIVDDSLQAMSRTDGTIINSYIPEGPITNTVSFMKFDGDKVLSGFGRGWNDSGIIQQFDGEEWNNFRLTDIEDVDGMLNFKAIWNASYDPKDNRRLYVGTWYGLYEFYDNKYITRHTTEGTSFNNISGAPTMVAVERLTFDKDGNIWALNTQSNDALHYRDENKQWHAINCNAIYNMQRSSDIIVTKKDNIKVVAAEIMKAGNGAICFIKSGSKPYIVANSRSFTDIPVTDGSTFSPTRIFCVTEDLNGDIWVGTDIGPIIFRNVANVFNNNYAATRIKLTRSDDATLADYLLATEQINTIVVDGANRKWIGTGSSGVYLLSSDGQKTIHHFTPENSPLTTNSITKIGINPENGMVYISTPNGMFSYKSDAAAGKEDLNDVHVYPNPIRPDYNGTITVTGLMENCEVRITDLQGHTISHGKSNGSIYTWNGHLEDGRRASTGVYLVFQATTDGTNKNVAKFAIIKR